jgi:hypothetical protein
MNIPIWLKPTKKQVADFKVVLKAFVKGVIIAGAGIAARKLGATPQETVLIMGATHPILKWLDPADKSIGIKKSK